MADSPIPSPHSLPNAAPAALLSALAEQWPGAVLVFDARHSLQWCNPLAAQLCTLPEADLQGAALAQLRLPWVLDEAQLRAAARGVPMELRLPDTSGAASGDHWRVRLRALDCAGAAFTLCIAEPQPTATAGAPGDEHTQLLAIAKAGVWRLQLTSDEGSVDESWCALHQLEACNGLNHIARWSSQLHPDDSAEYRRRVADMRSGANDNFEAEYRILARGNQWLWVLQRGRVVARDAAGVPLRAVGLCMDIDQRKREETDTKSNESRLATALWGARAAFWQWHLPTDQHTMSPMWFAMTGYTRAQWELVPDPWLSRVHAEDRPRIEAAVAGYCAGGSDSLEYEYRLMTAGGAWKWMVDRARAVEWDLEGRPALIMGVSLDIDAQKRAEMALRTSETRLKTAIWGARMGLWEMDCESDSTRWLDDWCAQYDVDPCDGPQHLDRWFARVHPADAEGAREHFAAHMAGKQDYFDAEYRVLTRAGVWRWVFARARVTERDESGRPRRIVGVCMDVDERRQEQVQQHFTQPWLEAALTVARAGMWHWQIEPRDVTYTDTYYRLFGADPIVARDDVHFWRDHLHPDDLERVRQLALDTVSGKTVQYEAEYRMRCVDGSYVWVLDRACALARDTAGHATRMVGFILDITAQRAEREALHAGEQRFRHATTAACAMIYDLDYSSGETRRFGTEALLGYATEEIGPRREQWLDFVHPEDVERFISARRVDDAGVVSSEIEYRLRHKDGHWVRVRDRGITVEERQGQPLRRIGFIQPADQAAEQTRAA